VLGLLVIATCCVQTVEALAAEERARKNDTFATKLTRALGANGHVKAARRVSSLPAPGRDLVAETEARATLGTLVLTETTRRSVEEFIEEQHRADLLRSHGLQPRHRVLLSGPPGNGKTVLAEAIAEALGISFFTVRYEALIGSFLGETAQRLGQLFAFARTTPCVLFFDEFDVVGKERGDAHETGEIKRVVSNLLLQIDSLPSHVISIGATNHSELLDSAVWRRFQLRLNMPSPTKEALAEFFGRALADLGKNSGIDPRALVQRIGLLSYAEATEFVLDIRRRHVLSLGQANYANVLREQVALWAARAKPAVHGKRSDQAPAQTRSTKSRAKKARRTEQNTLTGKISPSTTKRSPRTKVSPTSRGARSRSRTGATET
jgi:SpoVK/Ycf46/Vps4 family AAA+-type ATPase